MAHDVDKYLNPLLVMKVLPISNVTIFKFNTNSASKISINYKLNNLPMSRICPLTGKKPSTGHNVSHSQRKTNRRWLPNLISKRIYDPIAKRFVRLRISTNALRTLTKYMA